MTQRFVTAVSFMFVVFTLVLFGVIMQAVGYLDVKIAANLPPEAGASVPMPPLTASVAATVNLGLNDDVAPLDLTAESAFSYYVHGINGDKSEKILFEKKSNEELPIASLTKLMTALVVYENYLPQSAVTIQPTISGEFGGTGAITSGAVFSVDELLHYMLIASNNYAAYNLAEVMGLVRFAQMMNLKAEELGLTHTRYVNPAGLDPEGEVYDINHSTARDLSALVEYIYRNEPQIFKILTIPEYVVHDAEGNIYAVVKNTDKLLNDETLPVKILGGKTGTTDLAGQALILITESPDKQGILVNVVLRSKDRFKDMKKLILWDIASYAWH